MNKAIKSLIISILAIIAILGILVIHDAFSPSRNHLILPKPEFYQLR